ncbi:tRNA1(Val) (adenine(37)-N6)-methyltransferase [Aliiroseovarius sp. YM-037]|uniref:tRNA1(Val) (adenine(37)-N6)-methyltransferase n=1 Tax=Aliiroseovarius sp. YM-037 TaxID=3341728 RepID=UPI003A80D54F
MGFADSDLTSDAFLGGALTILQPAHGYRAGVDPVLLAASVPAKAGQSILELGCGAGVASLCLDHRVAGLSIDGVEVQADYADLATRNAEANGQDMSVHVADLRSLPETVKARRFDHVIMNPPYYSRDEGTAAADPGRDAALAGETPLEDWLSVAAKRLAPKGYLSLINDVRRLPELLTGLSGRLGGIEVLPLAARVGRAPHLVLVRARKGARGAFRLYAPCVMHEGARHERDGESYTQQISAVLRDGAPLPFPTR